MLTHVTRIKALWYYINLLVGLVYSNKFHAGWIEISASNSYIEFRADFSNSLLIFISVWKYLVYIFEKTFNRDLISEITAFAAEARYIPFWIWNRLSASPEISITKQTITYFYCMYVCLDNARHFLASTAVHRRVLHVKSRRNARDYAALTSTFYTTLQIHRVGLQFEKSFFNTTLERAWTLTSAEFLVL